MRKIVNSSKKQGGLVMGEIFLIAGAVIFGQYILEITSMSATSLLIALPAIFIGLVVRNYFSGVEK